MKKMVFLFILSILMGSVSFGYTVDKTLTLPAKGLSELAINCDTGDLKVRGSSQSNDIIVQAIIRVEGASKEKALQIIKDDATLTLGKEGKHALLTSDTDNGSSSGLFGSKEIYIDLEVTLPKSLGLVVHDGAGSINIAGMENGVTIDDGSGSIRVEDSRGEIVIDDGSGDLELASVSGEMLIDDNSGSLEINSINGSVSIHDNSGEITITEVQGDVDIEDGSGQNQHPQDSGISGDRRRNGFY